MWRRSVTTPRPRENDFIPSEWITLLALVGSRTLLPDTSSFQNAALSNPPYIRALHVATLLIDRHTFRKPVPSSHVLTPASIGDPIGKGFRQRRRELGCLDVLDRQGSRRLHWKGKRDSFRAAVPESAIAAVAYCSVISSPGPPYHGSQHGSRGFAAMPPTTEYT